MIDSVTYASYGTPSGSCSTGLHTDPSCNANVSLAVVKAACVGKAQCQVTASTATFGGVDPCNGDVKRLAAVVHCSEDPKPTPAPPRLRRYLGQIVGGEWEVSSRAVQPAIASVLSKLE